MHDIDAEFGLRKLSSLDTKKATGLEGIHAKLVKLGAPENYQSLNLSF